MNRIYDNFGCIPANHRICFVVILVTLSKVDKVSFIKSTLSYLVLVVILCYLVLVVNFILPCTCSQLYPTLFVWSILPYLVLVVNFILPCTCGQLYPIPCTCGQLYPIPCTCGQRHPTLYTVQYVWSTLSYLVRVVNFTLPCTCGQLWRSRLLELCCPDFVPLWTWSQLFKQNGRHKPCST